MVLKKLKPECKEAQFEAHWSHFCWKVTFQIRVNCFSQLIWFVELPNLCKSKWIYHLCQTISTTHVNNWIKMLNLVEYFPFINPSQESIFNNLSKDMLTVCRREPESCVKAQFLLPQTISSTNTPKLYTSALSVSCPLTRYAGTMYPLFW